MSDPSIAEEGGGQVQFVALTTTKAKQELPETEGLRGYGCCGGIRDVLKSDGVNEAKARPVGKLPWQRNKETFRRNNIDYIENWKGRPAF